MNSTDFYFTEGGRGPIPESKKKINSKKCLLRKPTKVVWKLEQYCACKTWWDWCLPSDLFFVKVSKDLERFEVEDNTVDETTASCFV